jgi:hypothetical protein
MTAGGTAGGGYSRWLWTILAVSLLLRLGLAATGGQGYFGDEPRYLRGPVLYTAALTGNREWARAVLGQPQHAGFTFVVLLIAPFHHAAVALTGGAWPEVEQIADTFFSTPLNPPDPLNGIGDTMPVAAALLGLFSTLNLWLVHRLAIASGASQREALFSTLIAASASSLFYYSRHLVPYDASLSAALAGLILCVSAANRRHQFMCGFCSALCFQIYNGHWFLVLLIGAALLYLRPGWQARLRAGAIWSLGAVACTAMITLPGTLISGSGYWSQSVEFSRTVVQGSFAEGWTLPFEYFRETEGLLGLALALLALGVLLRDATSHALPRRIVLWLALAAAAYALLVVASAGLHTFVVYGRTIRPVAIFFSLVVGYAVERLAGGRRLWRLAATGSIVAAATAQFVAPLNLTFPREVRRAIGREFGNPRFASTYDGVRPDRSLPDSTRPDLVLLNAQMIYPVGEFIGYPAGRVILDLSHPASYRPFQFDGLNPEERMRLRLNPPRMRLIQLDAPPADTK